MKIDARNLQTLPEIRQTYTRLIEAYSKDQVDAGRFRNLSYGFQVLVSIQKHEDEMRIEARIDAIEEAIARRGGAQGFGR